jgi:hypothetical protein
LSISFSPLKSVMELKNAMKNVGTMAMDRVKSTLFHLLHFR